MASVEGSGSLRCFRPSAGRRVFAERVREINHPREDAGAKAEPNVFVATACPAATAVAKPVETIIEILASDIAMPAESWFPSPPELHRPRQAVPLVQRFGVNARAAVRGRPSRSTPCSTVLPIRAQSSAGSCLQIVRDVVDEVVPRRRKSWIASSRHRLCGQRQQCDRRSYSDPPANRR